MKHWCINMVTLGLPLAYYHSNINSCQHTHYTMPAAQAFILKQLSVTTNTSCIVCIFFVTTRQLCVKYPADQILQAISHKYIQYPVCP